jgi:hypothetical protein
MISITLASLVFYAYILPVDDIVVTISASLPVALSTALLLAAFSAEGIPLIFTEKGIYLSPRVAELWEDIEEYGWETFRGMRRTSLSRQGEGTTLYIINKGFQHNIEPYFNHSVLSQYGIFFTPEQIQEAEKIFSQYGIRRIKNMAYVETTKEEDDKKDIQ